MVIVGANLEELIRGRRVVSNPKCFDEHSIVLSLYKDVIRMKAGGGTEPMIIDYGTAMPSECKSTEDISGPGGLLLAPDDCVLACSAETVEMPLGYMGFVQTKGSLARLFVSVICNDSQIEGGFIGKITLEMTNLGKATIRLRVGDQIAQLFVMKCSTKEHKAYDGRYQHAVGPTVSIAPKLE